MVALTSCDQSDRIPAKAYAHLEDKLVIQLGSIGDLLGGPCSTWEGRYRKYVGYKSCYVFAGPRMFDGVWEYEYEGSKFIEGTQPYGYDPESYRKYPQLEIDRARKLIRPEHLTYGANPDRPKIYAYRMKFVGRRTLYPVRHPYTGPASYVIVADKIISMKPLAGEKR